LNPPLLKTGQLAKNGANRPHSIGAFRPLAATILAARGGKRVTGAPTRIGIATGLVVVGDLVGSGEAQDALAASKGEKIPTTLDTGANVITKANLSSPRSQELLNPKIN
jgi:hypothetical protein